jgi:hypothetical protein
MSAFRLFVGAGFACPNVLTDVSVDVFGWADPTPTLVILINYLNLCNLW